MKSGELFAGVGGLGMAVNEVFGATPAWFAEFDTAPSKVLAHHYPDVPNYGDVTKLLDPPKVDILAGGFPCQDVSLAGRRRGMKEGTRSGLWSEFARIIDTVRPDWVVIENVRGLLSADAAGVVEPCPLCVGDDPGHVLRALGAVLGDLAELGFDAEWTGIRASDVGAPHGRFRVFILAWPATHTRNATDDGERARTRSGFGGAGVGLTLLPAPRTTDMNGPGSHGEGGMDLRTSVALLPTPMVGSSSPAAHGQISGDFRAAMDRVLEQVSLLPTPTVGNATGGNAQRGGNRAEEKLLPGLARDHETDWGPYTAAIRRWETVTGRTAPAPVRHDGKGGKPRLNPELTEWMMGWPAGWVTAPEIGLTRAEQLKGCGNGVVPQQAAAAQREMLARPGVPALSPTCRSDQEPGTRLLA